VRKMHVADALYSAVKCLIRAVLTEALDDQQDPACRVIHIAKPWTKTRWLESKLATAKPLVRIPKVNAHLVYFELNEDEEAHQQ
jgi:hypothetical protein